MSSNCGCGSSCKCGSDCNCGSKYSADLGYAESTSTETLVLGVHPVKPYSDGAEIAAESGCKCGSNCTCDPCNCK